VVYYLTFDNFNFDNFNFDNFNFDNFNFENFNLDNFNFENLWFVISGSDRKNRSAVVTIAVIFFCKLLIQVHRSAFC
jgi:hypothetical protein